MYSIFILLQLHIIQTYELKSFKIFNGCLIVYRPFFIYLDHLFTYAAIANSVVAGTSATACSIICAVTAATGTSVIAIVGIITAECTTAVASWMTVHDSDCCYDHLVVPFIDSMPSAVPKSSYASPSCVCGCRSKVCCDTL